jgi:tetratricopeptide (TPR) repeat protein
VNADVMFTNMMTKFQWGNMDQGQIYMDENNRRMATNLRLQFSHLSQELLERGDTARAVQALDKCMSVIPDKIVPFEQPQILYRMIELYFDAGQNQKGLELARKLMNQNDQEQAYYESLDKTRQDVMEREFTTRVQIADRVLERALKQNPNNPELKTWKEKHDQTMKQYGFEVEQAPKQLRVPRPQPKQDTLKPGTRNPADTLKM